MSARPPGGGAGTRSLRTVAAIAPPRPGRTRTRYQVVADGTAGGSRPGAAPRTNVRSSAAADTVTNLSFPNGRTVSSFVPVNVSATTAVGAPGTFAKLSAPGSAM